MSKIQEKIQALQKKQKKIGYISYISDLLKNDTTCHDYMDIKDEVLNDIEPFLIKLIDAIENEVAVETPSALALTEDEIKMVKLIVQRATTKVTETPAQLNNPYSAAGPQTPPPQKPRPPNQAISVHEAMNFGIANRHLADKRVTAVGDNGVTVAGRVVGMEAPNILVQMDNGQTIKVPLERINQV